LGEGGGLFEVDGFAAEALGLLQPFGNHVADDDDRGTEQVTRCGASQAHRTGTGDVDDRARTHTGGYRAVIAGGEDIAEECEVFDLGHGLGFVGEFQEVEVRIRDHDVFGLAADPTAHVDVAVRRTRPGRIDVEADAGASFLAVSAAAAGDVERDRNDVAFFDVFDIAAGFDHLAGDFVAEDKAGRRGGSATDHVLVGTADIGGDDFEDNPVFDLFAGGGTHQLGEVDAFNFNNAGLDVSQASIRCHSRASERDVRNGDLRQRTCYRLAFEWKTLKILILIVAWFLTLNLALTPVHNLNLHLNPKSAFCTLPDSDQYD